MNGYTGRLFEYEVLAFCETGWDGHSYVPFQKALSLVRTHQPWDPTDPSTRAGEDLHCQVALALGLENFSELAFFTAIGSPLDRFHGIDGLFVWHGRMVTIDLTIDPSKDQYKADLILRPNDEDNDWQLVATEIAARLQIRKGAFV